MEKCLNDELAQSKRLFEGIAHSTENDPNYKKLIEITSLINLTNENILSMMKNEYNKDICQGKPFNEKKSKYLNLLKHIDKWIKQQVVERNQNGWSIKTISSCFGIDIITVRAIIYKNRAENDERTLLWSPIKHFYRTRKEHIIAAEEYLKKNRTK